MTLSAGFPPHYKEIKARLDGRVTQLELWMNAHAGSWRKTMRTWTKQGCSSLEWGLVLITSLQERLTLSLIVMNKRLWPIFHHSMMGWGRSMPFFCSIEMALVNIFNTTVTHISIHYSVLIHDMYDLIFTWWSVLMLWAFSLPALTSFKQLEQVSR